MRHVPFPRAGLRLFLGPVLAALIVPEVAWPWLVLLLTLAVLSDVFDGVVARRADSLVDTLF